MMVSINVSPRSVNDALVDHILRALATHQVQPAMLEVEITETAVAADPLHSIDVLRRLRATGVRISLDDFGAGYTSLAYLTGLPLDTLKIDMGFITRLTEDRGHEAVTAAVIELGHRLGLTVLAEGVETDATRDRLESLGCDQMQGFLLTEPVPAKDLERWLRERAGTVTAALPGYSVA
jgi:EAL domain-containing protein (putative c-di-GMP-specific phosphodiesterase class I)